jgi:two-component system response regulator WspF
LLKKIHMIGRLGGLPSDKGKAARVQTSSRSVAPILIVIGSSTGGPKALAEVLSGIQAPCEAALVIVQHIDEAFSDGLASWLNQQSLIPVRPAVEGNRPEADKCYLAATNHHLILTADLTFSYTAQPQESAYRPSVDAFFLSVASNWPNTGVALLLTGMGRDGAFGLAALRKKGWHTIAQDEATSLVYGMPKAARDLNAAIEILPIHAIGPAVSHFFRQRLARP